jgi:hypothetical protein
LDAANGVSTTVPGLGLHPGLRRDHGPSVALAWLAPSSGLIVAALAGLTLWARATRRWSTTWAVGSMLVVAACLPTLALVVRWDLHTILL